MIKCWFHGVLQLSKAIYHVGTNHILTILDSQKIILVVVLPLTMPPWLRGPGQPKAGPKGQLGLGWGPKPGIGNKRELV